MSELVELAELVEYGHLQAPASTHVVVDRARGCGRRRRGGPDLGHRSAEKAPEKGKKIGRRMPVAS